MFNVVLKFLAKHKRNANTMSNGIRNPYSFDDATEVINEYAISDETDWVYTSHSDERGEQRNICQAYIKEALEKGNVTGVRTNTSKKGNIIYRYKVNYRTSYGETIVITVVPKQFKLVILSEW
ncbi:MAG: hypothetical protein ACI88H_001213 [Cocleimonas sp.]|jgi:hypothetical protein